MNATTDTTIANARRAIEAHVYGSQNEHVKNVERACHMRPVHPFSAAEFVEWIKTDKFKFNPEYDPKEELDSYRDVVYYIQFSTEEPDHKKYKEMCEKIQKDASAIIFHNKVLDPEKVMKEAEEYAKKTYH